MTDRTVNIIKKSLLFQIHQTEGIADIITAVINNLWLCADLAQLLLKGIALQNRAIVIIIMEGNHTYSFFFHSFLLSFLLKKHNGSDYYKF